MIYTSGSTGQPKGVEVTHGGIANSLDWVTGEMSISASDVFLNVLTPCFDMSVFSLFLPLSNGARLVMATVEESRNANKIDALVTSREVTVMKATPVTWLMLIEAGWKGRPDFKAAIGGEALTRPLAEALVARSAGLWNLYGPTEASIFCIGCKVESGVGPVPIGQPIANMQAYILDEEGRAVSPGSVGELYVSGVGLARGYRNRPELTAQTFLPDLFLDGARMYRTGDLARRRDDGIIDYLGRTDNQIKIRGYRVELEEVEAVLAAQPAVAHCAVIPRGEGDTRYLVACYSVRKGYLLPADGLRPPLAEQLPEYMIPSQFVEMAELPLTPSGKVDRIALSELRPEEQVATRDADADQAPRTELEAGLAGIARTLLNLPTLGCEEDLFDAGMHSLLAVRMAAGMAQELGLRTELGDIFDARTIRALAGRLASQSGGARDEVRIPQARNRDRIPLSWQQEQIWYLSKIAPESQAYNAQFTLRLRGRLNPEALTAVLTQIVERHEIFRTTFHDGPSGPVQKIHPAREAHVERVDFSHLDPEARELAVEQAIHKATRLVFNCSELPLVHWTLYRLAEEDHILLHVEHHLVHDGWEVAVLLRELQEFYTAAVEQRPPALEELPIQYGDYAVWQRSHLSGRTLGAKVRYWTDRLQDYPRVLDLSPGRERPAKQSFHGGALRVDMDRDLYAALQEFSRQRKVTLFVTMYSAFSILLSRYSGQKRMLVGTGVANRSRRDTQGLLGMFVNAVALTADLTNDPTFEELLAVTQRKMLEDSAYHDTPFNEIVRELKAGQVSDRNPLVQVLFAFHNSAVPVSDFAGLKGELIERHNGSAKMDMNLTCMPRAEQRVGLKERGGEEDLTMVFEYNSDLFDERTVERMLGHYLHLLREVLKAPSTRASEFDIVPAAERSHLLSEFNPPRVPYDRDRTLWELFAEVAERNPDKPAVLLPGKRVSYAELAAAAGRVSGALAKALEGRSLEPGFPVALCAGRSEAILAGMLGILRAGGAYLPVPPSYPEARIRLMLQDSNAAAVLAHGPGMTTLDGWKEKDCPVLNLETLMEPGELSGDVPPCAQPTAESAAYIIYTSGSTGLPKGTVVPHRAVHNLTLSLRRDLQGPDDVVAQLADYAFDATIFEIWGTLLTGGSIAMIDHDVVVDPERLERAMAEHGVTAAFFTTALFNLIAETRPQALASLRNVATGGEKVNLRAIERVMTQAPGTLRLWHVYGPTECTCFSTGYLCTSEQVKTGQLPIGKPLVNYTAYVLDEKRNPVPIGAPGELYLGGDGLATGYLNRPEFTADRFVSNPFATAQDRKENWNLRLYRTGDSVRWQEDGNIEFLGRLDEQVKVRGFRAEPGEIEAALARHPGVGLAAVTVREEPGGEKQLLAWVSPSPGATLEPDELRQFLQQTLPPYMIPARFTVLDRLPLTPSGKIDRRALPETSSVVEERETDEVSCPLTSQLIQLWEELLGVQPIGLHDDFFHLGGHSLLTVRMVNRLEDLFGRSVPVSTLFAASTISQLAKVLMAETPWKGTPPIQVQAGSSERPLFFFDGDWIGGGLYCRNLARLIGTDRPFYTIPPHGLDGGDVPASVPAMAADRLDALLRVQPEGPFVLCGYCAGGLVAFETARQLEARGHKVELVVLLDSVADAAGEIPWRRLRIRARPWIKSDWPGRAKLLGESVKRRLAPAKADEEPASPSDYGTFDWTRGAPAAYMRSLANYRLTPYSGRLSLIFTKDSPWDLDPETPWRETAPNLEIQWVPGDHTTALAVHAPETAGAIRDALKKVESGQRPVSLIEFLFHQTIVRRRSRARGSRQSVCSIPRWAATHSCT